MKVIGNILIGVCILLGLLAIRSFWREYQYNKVSSAEEAQIVSLKREDVKSTVAKFIYTLVYTKDGNKDTLTYPKIYVHSINDPLPPISTIENASYFVRYVPKDKRDETAFPDRIYINETGKPESLFPSSTLLMMFVCAIIAYMLKR